MNNNRRTLGAFGFCAIMYVLGFCENMAITALRSGYPRTERFTQRQSLYIAAAWPLWITYRIGKEADMKFERIFDTRAKP